MRPKCSTSSIRPARSTRAPSNLLAVPRVLFLVLMMVAGLAPLGAPAVAQEAGAEAAAGEVTVDRWLVAGPVASPMPAFAAETGVGRREALGPEALLPQWPYRAGEPWPADGAPFRWPGAADPRWEERRGEEISLAGGEGEPRLAWAATFVEVDRFTKATLTVTTSHRVRVFLDGEAVATKTSVEGAEDGDGDETDGDGEAAEDPEPGETTAELELHDAKHLLVFATVHDPAVDAPWTLSARLAPAEVADGEDTAGLPASLAVSASPERGVRIRDLLDPPSVAGVDLSADGTLVAVTLEQPAVPSEDRSTWVEVVRAADGALVRTLRLTTSISGFAWAPRGDGFAYRTSEGGKATLWVGDLGSGATPGAAGRLEPLLRDVEGLSSHRWAPDGESLFVGISEAAEKDDRGAVRVRSLADRLPGFRDLASVHQVSAVDGRSRRLTAGPRSSAIEDVSPDGRRLLLSRNRSVQERPFSRGELIEVDLQTLRPTLLATVTWLGSAAYSPDGETLLVTAGPSGFGAVGTALPEGVIPNEYDGQVYLVDLVAARRAGRTLDGPGSESESEEEGAAGEGAAAPTAHDLPASAVIAVTRDFIPAVNAARWSHDGSLYLLTTEATFGRLYRWDRRSGAFQRLEAGADVVSSLAVARTAPAIAYAGSSIQEPEAAWILPAPGGAPRPVLQPAEENYDQVRFGRVEDFDVTLPDGTVMPGRLYYPLDFDPEKKYPLLTYYYGGVVPTTRSFGGRYPKNWWAAHGYAVYVPQPSGAIGFGAERAARHVNDWGERVVEEVLAGVDAVVAAHPFLDGERVGCFGGSYGGFLTMRLVAESDRFAAAISHAGISGIASYWGEGWWGYLYMATAAAESYPWNRPDLFVERSPLFRADRVDTPLLLIHGSTDPNVPPGESDQMFAALRILGKEVEYVRIEGEAHWILTYPKRVLWWRTILAWFDLHLKDQPEGWEELWGEDLDRSGP